LKQANRNTFCLTNGLIFGTIVKIKHWKCVEGDKHWDNAYRELLVAEKQRMSQRQAHHPEQSGR
jgi:hypothetical protein